MSWGQNRYLDKDRQKKIFKGTEIETDMERETDQDRDREGKVNAILC